MTFEMPRLKCDTCHISAKCERYQKSAVCRFADDFRILAQKAQARDVDSLLDIGWTLLEINLIRYLRNIRFEAEKGGKLENALSALSKQVGQEVERLMAMERAASQIGAGKGEQRDRLSREGRSIVQLAQVLKEPDEIIALIERRRELIAVDRRLLEAKGVFLGGTSGSSARGRVVAETDLGEPPTLDRDWREADGDEG